MKIIRHLAPIVTIFAAFVFYGSARAQTPQGFSDGGLNTCSLSGPTASPYASLCYGYVSGQPSFFLYQPSSLSKSLSISVYPSGLGAVQISSVGNVTIPQMSLGPTQKFGLYSTTTNPIVSPETSNNPDPNAIYLSAPFVFGFDATVGAGAASGGNYANMLTADLTIPSAGSSLHWGLSTFAVDVLPSSGTMSGEVNVSKYTLQIESGAILANGINGAYEGGIINKGNLNIGYGFYDNLTNSPSGTVTGKLEGFHTTYANNNTTAGSLPDYFGVECDYHSGSGSVATHAYCLYDRDPTFEVALHGHVAYIKSATLPVVSSCGTGSPSLGSTSSDTMGTVTEGSSATTCTVTFGYIYDTTAPQCFVIPLNSAASAAPVTAITTSTTALTYTHSSATGGEYGYFCAGTT